MLVDHKDNPNFLYPNGAYDPENLDYALLQGDGLVKVRWRLYYILSAFTDSLRLSVMYTRAQVQWPSPLGYGQLDVDVYHKSTRSTTSLLR